MTISISIVTIKNLLFFGVFFMLFTVAGWFLADWYALVIGGLISLVNAGVYYGFYFYHKHRVSQYPAQALVVVINSTVVRFLLIGGLLILAYKETSLAANSLLLGFILGQLFFLIHHFLVKTNNVK